MFNWSTGKTQLKKLAREWSSERLCMSRKARLHWDISQVADKCVSTRVIDDAHYFYTYVLSNH